MLYLQRTVSDSGPEECGGVRFPTLLIDLLSKMRPDGFWVNSEQFTIPIFEATATTRR